MDPVEETQTGVVALLLDDLAPPRLGTLLRAARKKRSLTRRDVASRIGSTPNEIRRFERGDTPVAPSLIASLAECYGEDLTAQFVPHTPVHIDRRHITVGREDVDLRSDDDDEVLGTYVGIVARLRHSKPGEPIALRSDDLVALSTALGRDPEHVEARIVELLGCTHIEARSLHNELLRRKLVLPVAGLVTGLAVITGVGVGVAQATIDSSPAKTPHPAADASPAPTHDTVAPPTTVAAKPAVHQAPATTTADTTPDTTPAAPAVEPATTVPPTTSGPAAATPAVEDAAIPASAPVVVPDDTPMGIPPHETGTLIQP